MKSKLLIAVISGLLVFTTAGCNNEKSATAKPEAKTEITASAEKPKTIRIAYQPSPLYSSYFVAKNKGWLEEEFKKDGITIEGNVFYAGPPMTEAFAAGQEDFGYIGDTPPLLARANGIKIKELAVVAQGPDSIAILAEKNSKIQTLADLKGKKIGVAIGSNAFHFLYQALDKSGIQPTDVQIVQLKPQDAKVALQKGEIDAWSVWEPSIAQAETENIGKVIATAKGYKLGTNFVFVSEDFAKKYPDLVERYLKVELKTLDWISKNQTEARKIIEKELDLPADVVEKVFQRLDFSKPQLSNAVIQDQQTISSFLEKQQLAGRTVKVDEELVDRSFLEKLNVK